MVEQTELQDGQEAVEQPPVKFNREQFIARLMGTLTETAHERDQALVAQVATLAPTIIEQKAIAELGQDDEIDCAPGNYSRFCSTIGDLLATLAYQMPNRKLFILAAECYDKSYLYREDPAEALMIACQYVIAFSNYSAGMPYEEISTDLWMEQRSATYDQYKGMVEFSVNNLNLLTNAARAHNSLAQRLNNPQ